MLATKHFVVKKEMIQIESVNRHYNVFLCMIYRFFSWVLILFPTFSLNMVHFHYALYMFYYTFSRDYSGVCSPPVLHGINTAGSLDDVSTFSNISPRKPQSGSLR